MSSKLWVRFVLFLALLGIFGLDYLLHPGARRTQREMERELKSWPLPPDTTEQGFTSGFGRER